MRHRNRLGLAVIGLLLPATVCAWQLSPQGSFIERKLASRSQSWLERQLSNWTMRGIGIVGHTVHEEITNRMLGCEGEPDACGDPEYDADHAYHLAGVRWNDDPPFRFGAGHGRFDGCNTTQTVRLVTQPQCWANTFRDGKARAERGIALDGSNATLLVRSHFGDLQFLHAMASADGEDPETTQARILAWSEFAWRTSLGEYSLEQRVVDLDIPGFAELFKHNREWRIQDLFALGNPHIRAPEKMSRVAFGSLLHLVQDSFAPGHAERRTPIHDQRCTEYGSESQPGRILEFHSYTHQDSGKHGEGDAHGSFSAHWTADKPNVIDVGRVLQRLNKDKAPWESVKPYLECVFALDEQARKASAGEGYGRDGE